MSAVDDDQIADWSQEIIGDLIACEALRDDGQTYEDTLKLHGAIAKTLRHIVEWVAEEAQERVAGHVSWSPIIHPDFDKGFLAGLSHGYHLGEEGDERRFYMSRETYLARVGDRSRLLALYDAQRAALSAEGSGTLAAARKQAAEEMRERIIQAIRETPVMADLTDQPDTFAEGVDAAEWAFVKAIRALPLPPSSSPEDQEKAKAAATPTIADPDGESGR